MKNYKSRLQNLIDEALYDLNLLRDTKGKESKFSNEKVLKIKDDNFMFNLDGSRYLVEFGEKELIDNSGYKYNCHVLDTFDLLDVLDHLKEVYNVK